MYHLANLAEQLWNVNPSFEATQNNSWVGQQVSHSSCFGIAAWESQFAYYPCIAQALSQLTQLSTCPRDVFFEELDQGAATSFAGILFGLAAVLVAQSAVLKSKAHAKQGQRRQQQQSRESMDSIQRMSMDSVHTGLPSGSGSGAPLEVVPRPTKLGSAHSYGGGYLAEVASDSLTLSNWHRAAGTLEPSTSVRNYVHTSAISSNH